MDLILSQKNLLVICHSYNSFQKDPIDKLSKFFKNVYVLVRYNPLTKLSKFLPFSSLDRFTVERKIDKKKKPSNVKIFLTPILYGPFKFQYKKVGNYHYKAVERIIKKFSIKFDIIFSQFAYSSGFVGAKLKEKFLVPLIVQGLGYDIYDLPFRDSFWRNKIKYVLNQADLIITVSNFCLECITKLNIHQKVVLIPNGFDEDLFHPSDMLKNRSKLNLPMDKKIILNIGNLIKIKGQTYLIDAIKELVKIREDIFCIIIGNGKYKRKLIKKIKKLKLEKNIVIQNGIIHAEIATWINASDLFVFPSIKESFGVVQIEALACGKPVLATKNGGSQEIITNDKIGCLIEPKDSNLLSVNLAKMLNKNYNSEFIADYAIIHYSLNEIVKRLKTELEFLLN